MLWRPTKKTTLRSTPVVETGGGSLIKGKCLKRYNSSLIEGKYLNRYKKSLIKGKYPQSLQRRPLGEPRVKW